MGQGKGRILEWQPGGNIVHFTGPVGNLNQHGGHPRDHKYIYKVDLRIQRQLGHDILEENNTIRGG